jgi:hypothetical protein
VLINGADMPVEDELPEDLKSLCTRSSFATRDLLPTPTPSPRL